MRNFLWLLLLSWVLTGCQQGPSPASSTAVAQPAGPALAFQMQEGRIHSNFYRRGPVAAHLLLTEGSQPRFIAAFPAGNSGMGLWFDTPTTVNWQWQGDLEPLAVEEPGQRYYGVQGKVIVTGGELILNKVLLGSIRILRDYQQTGRVPPQVDDATLSRGPDSLSWSRKRLDGQAGYRLTLELDSGSIVQDPQSGAVRLRPVDQSLVMTIRVLNSEPPLTPLDNPLNAGLPVPDTRLEQSLAFLTYEEKWLAGSWRFLTYFGRDSLLSLRLLMPVLTDEAIESALGSVFERMSAQGRVAHEEDIGEFALLRRLQQGQVQNDSPLYDYAMRDDDLLLLPVLAEYLLDERVDRQRRQAFLQRQRSDGKRYGQMLAANIDYLLSVTRPFYEEPRFANLIGVGEDHYAGNWRDSEEGLDGARFPYDVNMVLAPAALRAAEKLYQSGLLQEPRQSSQQIAELADMARHWQRHVAPLFAVQIEPEQANEAIRSYSAKMGVPGRTTDSPVEFSALALDKKGIPVPVVHSDTGFDLLFGHPDEQRLRQILGNLKADFPLGLYTPVGMLVANPVFASEATRHRFGPGNYHGTVVWNWQQAMVISGIDRQLQRTDLSASTLVLLEQAKDKLWQAVSATQSLKTSELWSWSYDSDRFHMQPFGQRHGDITESNPVQLWSTVFLAIQP
ncbi:hypothetical protein [Bowmanella dokdonensis]|uniref:Lipoprotein n=1 Tax=Bowmanella dokdonensis TaxID=751969 RepID=A0A939DK90_9ALTE|nr:hypothetical protein [Bowmanella dokdonensis]MBN7824033.1 hypothetical protein [Bowmanella dokdonensis]